ncbi:MAG: hypothetical protein JWP69_442 [Flaviaesturariibacter sp.]|nr:hypothetical protein [Flaviaesturariibacter sp.]
MLLSLFLLLLSGLLIVLYSNRKALRKYFVATPLLVPASTDRAFADTDYTGNAESPVDDLSMEIDDLHWLLNNKKQDLQQLKSEQVLKGENAVKLDAIEDTIEVIEDRLRKLQGNLSNVRNTAVALDELTVACQQMQNSLSQSQQSQHLIQSENESLRLQLDELQAYTADIKEQRQLLQKKVRLLEELHSHSRPL